MLEQTSLQCTEHLQTDQTVALGQQMVQGQQVAQGQQTTHGQQVTQGQQATQSSTSPDQAVDQHAGAGGMFSTHIIALHDGGSCMSLLTVYTSYVCVCSEWMI